MNQSYLTIDFMAGDARFTLRATPVAERRCDFLLSCIFHWVIGIEFNDLPIRRWEVWWWHMQQIRLCWRAVFTPCCCCFRLFLQRLRALFFFLVLKVKNLARELAAIVVLHSISWLLTAALVGWPSSGKAWYTIRRTHEVSEYFDAFLSSRIIHIQNGTKGGKGRLRYR